jgi:hypothetical protein
MTSMDKELGQALHAFLQSIPKPTKREQAARQPKESEIEDGIKWLQQVWETNGLALYRRIQTQSGIGDVDRKELMDLAANAVNGGLFITSLQEGGRRWLAKQPTSKRARDRRSENAADWRAKAEELANGYWIKKPNSSGYARNTAEEIYPDLKKAFPEAKAKAKVETVAKHLSTMPACRERMNKKICSSS